MGSLVGALDHLVNGFIENEERGRMGHQIKPPLANSAPL